MNRSEFPLFSVYARRSRGPPRCGVAGLTRVVVRRRLDFGPQSARTHFRRPGALALAVFTARGYTVPEFVDQYRTLSAKAKP